MKTSELTGVALDWAVAKCKGMLEPEPKTATWNEVKDLPIPFKLYEVTDVYNNNKFIKCVVSDITVTRCGIDESVAATAPSVTFTDAHNRQARGSIQNYFLTEKDAIAEARLTESGGKYWDGFTPSTNWAQGGPIIEREQMAIWPDENGGWLASANEGKGHDIYGVTPLVAAMRCYVASKLGDDVQLPEELCQ